LCKMTSRSCGRKFETSVGNPIPRLTTMPSAMSAATRAAICSRLLPRVVIISTGTRRRQCWGAHDSVHEDPGRDDRLGIEGAERDDLADLGDRTARGRSHERPEVAGRLAIDEVAPAIRAVRL